MVEEMKLLAVTQEDRDAAAELTLADLDGPEGASEASYMRRGMSDALPVVQAFARHRLAHSNEGWRVPTAIAEQACSTSKSGETVLIECDDADDANEVFDWLCSLPSLESQEGQDHG